MSKIFEEAIADAKKLKEVAEENAKQAILESVTPKIREFIEEQLLESEEISEEEEVVGEEKNIEEDYNDSLEEQVYLDESALQSLVNLLGEDALDSLNESKSKDALIGAVKGAVSSMEDTDREKLLALSNKINESADYLSREKGENDMSRKYYEVDLRTLRESVEEENKNSELGENELMQELSKLFEQEDAEEDDLSLELGEEEAEEAEAGGETLLKSEVEAEIQELVDSLGLSLSEEADEAEEVEAPIIPELEDEEEVGEAAPEDLQEVFEVDPKVLRQEINRIKRMMSEGKVEHHFGGKAGGKAGVDGAFGGKGKSNAGVKGAFGGGKEGQDAFTNPPQINKLNEAIRNLRRQNRSQSEKLNKYRGAVNSLREQLEELNLFNAKLLYVNKLLQNKALTESQKKSVIKALDESNNLQEAKSLYTSLTETLSRSTDKKTLSESRIIGSSSKSTTSSQSVKPSTSNNEVSRWQKLAGL